MFGVARPRSIPHRSAPRALFSLFDWTLPAKLKSEMITPEQTRENPLPPLSQRFLQFPVMHSVPHFHTASGKFDVSLQFGNAAFSSLMQLSKFDCGDASQSVDTWAIREMVSSPHDAVMSQFQTCLSA